MASSRRAHGEQALGGTRQHGARMSNDSLHTTFDFQAMPDAGRPSLSRPIEDTTLDPAHPRDLQSPVVTLPGKAYRQLLGLNPFKTSYLSLYSTLDTPHDRVVACGAALFAVAAGIPLPIIGVIFGKLISSFPPTEDELVTRISQLLGVAVAYFVVTALYATLFGFTGEKVAITTREKLLQCLLQLDQAYLDTHDIDVNGLLTEKVDSVHAGCSEKAGIFVQTICYFVAAFTVGFVLSPKLTGILLAAIIPSLAIVIKLTSVYGSRYSKRVTEYNEAANGIVDCALRAVKVVQAYGMMERICSKHSDVLSDKVAAAMRKALVAALEIGFIYFLIYSINGLAFYVGSRIAASGQRGGDAGTIFAVVFLILDSSLVVAQFAPILEIFAQAASAREAIQGLLDATSGAGNPRNPTLMPLDLHGRDLQLHDVIFAYPARPTVNVLNGLHLTCKAGNFTALVGTSGGGKSTLVSLLTGAYSYHGGISFGDRDLSTLSRADVNSQLAVVEQEHVLFTGTIFDNICHGVRNLALPQAELTQRCEQALKEANVDFLEGLPQGLHTRIGDGLQLSGGQQQRLCLARALIRKPAVLVLDEPTSALDARSELAVMTAIQRAAASGTTVIMVAHRLSTVLDADHVAVFCDGKVVEAGPPRSLAADNGFFKSLLDAQNTELSDPLEDQGGQSNGVLFGKAAAFDNLSSSSDSEMSGSPGAKSSSSDERDITIRMAMRELGANIWPDCLIIAVGLMGSVASGGLLLGEAILFGNLVQLLNTGVSDPDFQEHANFFCLLFFVLGCVGLVSWVCSGTAFGIASTRSIGRIQSRLLSVMIYLDMEFFTTADHSADRLMSAFTKDSGDLSCLSGPALGTIFTTSTSLIGGMVLALVVAWKIAVVLLAAVPVMLAAGFMRLRILGSADARRREAYCEATSLAVEACRNRRTVAVYGLEDHLFDQYRKALRQSFHKGRWFLVTSNVLLALSFAITYFVYALAYWWGSKQVRNGSYEGKQFFIVLPALLFSAQSSGQLFSLSPEIARAKAAARSILKLLSYQPQILQPNTAGKLDSPTAISHEKQGSICDRNTAKFAFDQVSLAYPSAGERFVLNNISLAVKAGHSIGLVGASGAGKSSALALMERFYDPVGGSVRLDGVDIRELDILDLRERISLVSQDPDLLPGSIAYNIRLGCRKGQAISDEDVHEICKRCGLHEFISSLPEGYDTDCGSKSSSKVSGGQKQRIALARALIRDPEILLLDEPTSALDAHSEQYVQESLAEASNGRTTVTVAHRLASVKRADKIYVFDQGRIVEQGTHLQLVEHGGLYASMAKAQNLS